MSITYAQKNENAVQTKREKSVSIIDASFQNESLQRKADMVNNTAQRAEVPRPNNTGMPDNLKAGIESLSGFSMDDVRVHYNSSKPATVQALAYTQGTDIHVAPGQEKYLPHEAWHVAQQMAGRVSPTTNINGMPVNDNAALEHEADVMGEKAVQCMKKIKPIQNLSMNCECAVFQRVPSVASEVMDFKTLKIKLSDKTGIPKKDIEKVYASFRADTTNYDSMDSCLSFYEKEMYPFFYDSPASAGSASASAKQKFIVECIKEKEAFKNKIYAIKYDEKVVCKGNIPSGSIIYMKKVDCADKILALQHIAEQAALIGNCLNDLHKCMVEHLKVVICTNYLTSQNNETTLNITYTFGTKDNPGYVDRIERGKGPEGKDFGKMVMGSRVDLEGKTSIHLYGHEIDLVSRNLTRYKVEKFQDVDQVVDLDPGEFTNVHHHSENFGILSNTKREFVNPNNKNEGRFPRSAENWDAYTKLVGEGARFKCVRRNVQYINDDTVFFAPGKSAGVKFSELWCAWKNSFDGKYDIEDGVIAAELLRTEAVIVDGKIKNRRKTENTLDKGNGFTEITPLPENHENCVELNGSSVLSSPSP